MMSRFFLGLKPTQVVLAGMICSLLLLVSTASGQQSPTFEIQFGEQVFSDSFSGDLFIAFSQEGEPRASMHRWFGAPPLAKFRVSDVEPGKKLTINLSDAVARHPADWTGVVGKQWQIQAVARVNPIAREAGLGEDDIYGEPVQALLNAGEAIKLELDTVVETKPFKESERIRLFETESPSLSKFFGFSYPVKAGVMLPENHDPTKKYPVVYDITGFGGTHSSIRRKLSRLPKDSYLHQCIVVVPDANNRYGHSVFCNSRSIGPWGDALVRDMIPQLEAKFGGAGAKHRYVTGVSSGGWSCLYLQITYPKEFAGCWSHVPDPIDFHDFQQINLYEPLPNGNPRNMFVDENGQRRPLARRGTEVMLAYEDFVRREHVTNPGGQVRSFEATFSYPQSDGTPKRVFNVETGEIDHEVAQTWKEYDLSHQLLTNWDELKGDLAGKIHIFAGAVDTFYLNGAVERFQKLADEAGLLDQIEVKVIPNMAHSLYKKGNDEMIKTIKERFQSQLN